MNARILAAISVLANVALVLVALRAGRRPAAGAAAAGAAQPTMASESLRIRTNLTRVELTETNEAPPFHWREVQSEDLKEFAANLRGIGCPPETARAILESELWARFLPRRRALLDPFHRQYWDLAVSGPNIEKATDPFREAVKKLKAETLGKLDEIVGGEAAPEERKRQRDRQVDFLSEEKQRALEDFEKRFNEENARVHPAKGVKMTPELQAKRDELQAQRKAGIRAVMTPEEYAEYELRQSRHTGTAQSSVGFEATPEEARAMARLYQQSDTADARPDRKDPNFEAKKAQAAAAKKQREEALKQTLGEERYAQFQQGLDGSFGEIYRITTRYELPRETAAHAAETLKARGDALKRLQADKAMGGQEREERALGVNLETRAAMLGVLGDRALRTYEKYHEPIVPQPKEAGDGLP